MRIQHNIQAMNAYRHYNNNTKALAKNLEKLSSGYRINRAGDDAAGLAISEKMRAQITGLEVAQKNAKDGISLVQTAEGAMTEVHDMLNRMYELAEQSANGTYKDEVDREQMQKEIDSLSAEINRIADSTNFNGIKLLDGSLGMADSMKVSTLPEEDAKAVQDFVTDILTAGSTKGTNTILHKDGTNAQAGSFTIDFSQVTQKADGTNTAEFTLKVGNATLSLKAKDQNTGLTAADIGTALNGMQLKVTGGQAASFHGSLGTGSTNVLFNTSPASLSVADKDVVYTATNNGDGTVTFKLDSYYKGTNTTSDKIDLSADNTPTSAVADDTNLISPNFKVELAVTAGKGNAFEHAENIQTTNVSQPKKPGAAEFGNTTVDLDISKLQNGMELTIGKVTKKIGSNIKIDDLTADLADPAKKTAAMTELGNRITQAFGNTAENTNGISVGFKTDGTNFQLTLSEVVDPTTGKSTAHADNQKAMSDINTFKDLVKLSTPAQKAGVQIDITEADVKEGDSVTIDGTRYVFTDDATKTDGDGTAYVKITGGAIDNLKTKLDAVKDEDGNTKYSVTKKGATGLQISSVAGEKVNVPNTGLVLQIGDTSESFNKMKVAIKDMHTAGMGIGNISVASQDEASDAMTAIKNAINYVSDVRGDLGSMQNRLDHTISNLSVMQENIQDAEATIRDVDVAEEMMAYTKNNILVQSAQAMLAQANQLPQGVLQLLQ